MSQRSPQAEWVGPDEGVEMEQSGRAAADRWSYKAFLNSLSMHRRLVSAWFA